ncbi:MAG: ATP-binding protein, partial [Candidatus Hecatellales archaeon B24]
SKNYSITLMDMEAGLEHLSRRTDRDVDIMVVVVDRSRLGYLTAKRIKELAREVHIDFKRILAVGNNVEPEFEDAVRKQVVEAGLEFAGFIPSDPNIASYDLEGKSLLELPEDSLAVKAAKEIAEKLGLI